VAKKFEKNVLNLLPGYGCVENIFYPFPAKEILFGYAYSRQSSGIQAYLYVLPLYVRSDFLHLGFSVCLPHPLGRISITNALEKRFLGRNGKYTSPNDPAVACDFLQACLAFKSSNFIYGENIDGFIQMLLDRSQPNYDGPLGPLMVDASLRIYSLAASLILRGDIDLAVSDLQMLLDNRIVSQHTDEFSQTYTLDLRHGEGNLRQDENIYRNRDNPIMEDAKELYRLIGKSVSAAVQWLKDVEENNKLRFTIK